MKPQKHAEVIIAWANGAEIEFWSLTDNKWVTPYFPVWIEDFQYRVKPGEVIEDVKKELTAEDIDLLFKSMRELIDDISDDLAGQQDEIQSIGESVKALRKVINVNTHF